MHTKIKELLDLAINNKASDVHIVSGILPKLRVNGELIDVGNFENNKELMDEMILSILEANQIDVLKKDKELDYSLDVGIARFRVNVYYQQGNLGCAMRVIPLIIPNMDELNLPEVIQSLVNLRQGFVLITGPTSHGKSTTVASILNEINLKKAVHIVTVEDPIEYLIKPVKSIVSQRELGTDTISFVNGLRSCLRQDPNVLFVGEMRDLETISSAMTIAETGHLVFSTLHTNSASQTVDRIIDIFPEGAKNQVRSQLASVLSVVISERLVRSNSGELLPAFEIMINNSAIKNAIRDNKTYVIDNVIQTSVEMGMMTLEMSLAKLVKNGQVNEDTAESYVMRPADFKGYLRDISQVKR